LQRALANVREFITASDELIVVDGASSDDTHLVVARNQDIVTQFLSEPDFGEAHGYNKAILLARGEFIKFITDDDYFYPDAMWRLIDFLEQHDGIEAVVCGGEVYEAEPGGQASRLVKYIRLPADKILRDSVDHVLKHAYCGVGLCLRRAVVARAGLLNTTFLPIDLEYMARLVACQVNFVYLDIKLFRLNVYAHSGHRDWSRTERDIIRILITNGAWISLADYPTEAVGRALGLWNLPGGTELTGLIAGAEQARRFGRILSLRAALCGLRAVHWVRMAPEKIRHWFRPGSGTIQPPAPLVEPLWDGGQR
jgi:glycosyltransferase involved in cell wall biosynthesis